MNPRHSFKETLFVNMGQIAKIGISLNVIPVKQTRNRRSMKSIQSWLSFKKSIRAIIFMHLKLVFLSVMSLELRLAKLYRSEQIMVFGYAYFGNMIVSWDNGFVEVIIKVFTLTREENMLHHHYTTSNTMHTLTMTRDALITGISFKFNILLIGK